MSLAAKAALGLILCALSIAAISPSHAADDPRVDRYLQRLGLESLRLRHLERSLERTPMSAGRTASARKLAQAYVEQMLATADDPAATSDLEKRVRALIEKVPEASTPELQLLLLQAQYQQAETMMLAWMRRDAAPPSLIGTASRLDDLAGRFATHHKSLSAEVEKLSQSLDDNTPVARRNSLEQQASQKQALASRAQFLVGWSNYYLGIADPKKIESDQVFEKAQAAFCDLLGLAPDKEYADVEAEGLGLESLWRSRAVIGLGLTECALDRPAAAERVFGWLKHPSVPLALRDQGPYWHLQGLLNAEKLSAAQKLAEEQLKTFGPGQSTGRTSFCVLLVRVGFAGQTPSTEARALGELGILGLARLRQFDALGTLMANHRVEATSPLTQFYVTWLDARRKFTEAEQSKSADQYNAARDAFVETLKSPEAQKDLPVSGRCRLGLAWCEYRLEQYEQAAKNFRDAAPLLKSEAPDDALQAAWMESVCFYQLATKQPRYVPQAVAALEAVQRDYPKSAEAGKARSLVERLKPELATPAERMKRFLAIPAGDPRYTDAQFELCQLQHTEWASQRTDGGDAQATGDAVVASARRFLQSLDGEGDSARRLRASLLALEVLLADRAGASPPTSEIQYFLDVADKATEGTSPTDRSLAELHYRRLQFAQRGSDSPAVRAEADWLVKNAASTPFELTALMIVAQQADSAVEQSRKNGEPREQYLEAVRAAESSYGRLVTLLGDSPEKLKASRNALAASSRHAYYLEQQQSWQAAADRLDKLVAAFPNDRNYLRRSGIALHNAGRLDLALPHWRKLLSGLESGSDPWLEAKYYQIESLLAIDRASAEKVWKQFRLLYPSVDSPAWKEKFAALARRMEGS